MKRLPQVHHGLQFSLSGERTQVLKPYFHSCKTLANIMKRVLTAFLFLTFSAFVKGQSNSWFVAPTNYHVMLRDRANPFKITHDSYPCEDVIITVSNGTIRTQEHLRSCNFLVEPGEGKETIVKLWTIQNGDTVQIGGTTFTVVDIPIEITHIIVGHGNRNGRWIKVSSPLTEISKTRITNATGLSLFSQTPEYISWQWLLKYDVQSFDMVFNLGKPDQIKFHSDSPLATEEMLAFLKTLKSGDKVFFENIIVKYAEGLYPPSEVTDETRMIEGCGLKIK